MKSAKVAVVPILTITVTAQTPANFTVVTAAPLLAYSNPTNTSIEPPGILLPPSDVLYSPSLYLPSDYSSSAPYIGIQIDAELPLLHWLQPNLVAQPGGNLTVDSSIAGASKVECPYLAPEPPAGGGPHRYVIMLFQQPENWTIPSNYSSIDPPANLYARAYFDLPDFLSSSGLGDPIGATFFRAMNGTAQQSASAETATISNSAVPAVGTSATTTVNAGETSSSSVGIPVATSATATVTASEVPSSIISTPIASYSGGVMPMKNSVIEAAVIAVGSLLFLL